MAAPLEINVHNMNATFDMDKKISDSTTAMLKMQGLGFIVRNAAAYSAIQVILKQYIGEDGIEHLDQEQISTGGVKQEEPRLLDGSEGERDIQYWGQVKGRNKYIKISEIDGGGDPFLKQDWLEEGEGDKKGDVIESFTESKNNGWTAYQIWGFSMVNGQRHHVRRIYSKKGTEEHRIRLVYDFKSAP